MPGKTNGHHTGTYSNVVPLESSLIQYAASCLGTTGVSKVLVLFTGGAIGMQEYKGVYQTRPQFLVSYLMDMPIFNDKNFWRYAPLSEGVVYDKPMAIETSAPSSVSVPLAMPLNEEGRRILYRVVEYCELQDSSNCGFEEWVGLARDIERFYGSFDGFVVIHGTDTLAYAAAALSFIMEGLSKPVVLTGSELPLDRLRNDARHNLLGALLFAGGAGGHSVPEVTVFCQNELYRGNRIVKSATSDLMAVASPNSKPLGVMRERIEVYEDRIWPGSNLTSKHLRVHTSLCPNVAICRLFPSISIDAVRSFFRPPMQGVILQTYGTGNVPSNCKELIDVLREAHEKYKIILFNVTQCWKGTVAGVYATGAILDTVGAVSGYDITTEAALMKMAYVLDKWDDPMMQRRMLSVSLRGEMTEPVVQTRSLLPRKLDVPRRRLDVCSGEVTKALGRVLLDAVASGLNGVWSEQTFYSVLCAAAANNDVEVLKQMLRIAGHFEYADKRRVHPMLVAAGAGSYEACRLMLEHGGRASANLADLRGLTPLSYAVRGTRASPALTLLLRRCGGRLATNDVASSRAREMNAAAAGGRLRRLHHLLIAGFSPEELDTEGRSALHTAVVYHRTDVVRYLIARPRVCVGSEAEIPGDDKSCFGKGGAGVDVNQLTSYGTSALEEARKRNFADIVEILEQAVT